MLAVHQVAAGADIQTQLALSKSLVWQASCFGLQVHQRYEPPTTSTVWDSALHQSCPRALLSQSGGLPRAAGPGAHIPQVSPL